MALGGVKTLIQKRLDKAKWNLGPVMPGGIRLLTDKQGNIIAIATVPVNPQEAEPIGPGSAGNVGVLDSSGTRIDPATAVDPVINLAEFFQSPYSRIPEVYSDDVVIHAEITSTNTDATFHEDADDYVVPASKKTRFYRAIFASTVVSMQYGIGYGDDEVVDGTANPANPVLFWGRDNGTGSALYGSPTAKVFTDIPISIKVPAGKYPFLLTLGTNGTKSMILFGVELDA